MISNPVGRPTKYNDETLRKANEYINGGYDDIEHVIPTTVGLAIYLGITSTTCYDWAKDKPEFSAILRRLMDIQQQVCLQGGMTGRFNPTITKLVLSKHGYSDRVEQVIDHISSDDSMKPAVFQGVSKNPRTGMLGDKVDARTIPAPVKVEYEVVEEEHTTNKQSTFKHGGVARGRPAPPASTGALARRRKARDV